MAKLRMLVGIVGLCIAGAAPADANAVRDWNAITLLYVSVGDPTAVPAIPVGRPGPPGLLDIALVQLAVHDAVQAIEGRFEPYHYSNPSALGIGSPAAAAAAAAHRVLVLLYPGQQASLDSRYAAYVATHGLAGDPGLAVGEAAAAALHAAHYRPPISLPDDFGNTGIGQWRSGTAFAFKYLAVSTPFALNRVSQFRPPPPPPMTSMKYTREYEEVAALGDADAHPNGQTNLARFWSGNFFAQWNEALRQLTVTQQLGIGDSARLFALAGVAAADAAMAVWESKAFYNFWRPNTAIQNGDADPNRRTVGDPGWTSLLANPPYPDYVSGANGLTGAMTGMATLFFGTDDVAFSVRSIPAQAGNLERFFTRFSDAAQEVVEARILLGIHFRSADEEARRLGNRVAHWVYQKYLRPVPGT